MLIVPPSRPLTHRPILIRLETFESFRGQEHNELCPIRGPGYHIRLKV